MTDSDHAAGAFSNEVPSFGTLLFAASANDLHAARIELPFGGSGTFNITEPELSLVTSGRVWMEAADFRGWIESGSFCVLPPGPHRSTMAPGTVGYSVGLGTPLTGVNAVTATVAALPDRAFREWRDRVEAIHEDPSTNRTELRVALAPYLTDTVERRAGRRFGLVNAFLETLERSTETTLTLAELGETFGYAPNHLNDLIAATTGRSIRRWQIMLRLDAARRALATSNRSIVEVAASLGFDASFFARVFRQRFGLSPSQWRAAVAAPTQLASLAKDHAVDATVHIVTPSESPEISRPVAS